MMRKKATDIYTILASLTLAIILIGTVFYHFVERLSWLNSFYFSVVTLATVGYGDIVPKTDIGKLFTVFYIFIGVGIISAFFRAVVLRAKDRRKKRLKGRNKKG